MLNFTKFFVPRANSCPMGLLFGHLGSHIEFPLDSKNRGKIGVIGVEMKGMESSMKLVALGATQRRG